jgi:ATP-binding cassette subfamily B protein
MEGGAEKRAARRPLLALRPYLLRHKGMLAGALVALLVSAGATLAVPLAVRRMIDLGFSGIEPDLTTNTLPRSPASASSSRWRARRASTR